MIKPEELRLPSLVSFEGMICKASETNIFEDETLAERIEPIPLTEEWMTKLGLRTDGYSESYSVQIGDDNYYSDGGNIIIINTQKYNDGESYTGDGWLFCTLSTLTSDFDSYGFKSRIKYVHQLQNLYFSLTGEEL